MMGDFFKVDLGVLKDFVTSLHDSDGHMNDALEALKDTDDGKQIGTDDLNDAANDFQDTWQYGMKQIHSMTKETGDGVNGAYSEYQKVEQEISGVLDKINKTLGPDAPAGAH